jgi:ABC-type branched-subunit amino acid transport system permease subunit
MKTLITFLMVLTLAFSAQAQFVNGPSPQSALVAGSGFVVPGFVLTNIPAASAPIFRAGRDGVFLYIKTIGTNALTVTNCTATVELLGGPEGTNVIDNQTYTITFTTAGTAVSDYGTNIPSSAANILNVPALRLRSITNVNSQSIIISNITAYTR